ncbi:MAG: UDP-glucose 4-epimerase GalE [Pseudohongiellaceae bacterium]
MKILICGGAGYIGSHMTLHALAQGHEVVVIDNLSTGHAEAVPKGLLVEMDVCDTPALTQFLSVNRFDLVMHFCAFSLVGESVDNPSKYYQNNVGGTLSLLQAMLTTGHKNLVFSSTAAVYGIPGNNLVTEDCRLQPINPYGRSKWMVEQILQDYAHAFALNSVSLRYFNAAGADPQGRIGEKHHPETHLVPNILKRLAADDGQDLSVFGDDYPTRDGTCERDYIHINDLASAHLLAGEYLAANPGAHAFNLGNGIGYTVMEIIRAAEKVTRKKARLVTSSRRPGDPPSLVADATRARQALGWKPAMDNVEDLIKTAWGWHQHEIFRVQ